MCDFMNAMKDFMPTLPPMPDGTAWKWPGQKEGSKEERKEKWEEFKSNVGTFGDQLRDMQKSSLEATKEQWNTFFAQCMEMQESFAASLPDELPSLPGISFLPALTPKAFVEKKKEFLEMANEHALEQADSLFDFLMQRQEQIKTTVSEVVENVETRVENAAAGDTVVEEAAAEDAATADAQEVGDNAE